jgi:hypothetical protein
LAVLMLSISSVGTGVVVAAEAKGRTRAVVDRVEVSAL